MKGYGQYCPVALTIELLGDRWTMLVVRELLAGSTRFNEMRRGLPRVSPSLLSQRLRSLEEAGVVDRIERAGSGAVEYRLTEAGHDLIPVVSSLADWGSRWSRELREDDLDGGFLMWDLRRRLDLEALPNGRLVLMFEFYDASPEQRRFWLLCDRGDVDVCTRDPGGETNLRIATTLKDFVEVWLGRRPLRAAIRAGDVRLQGPSALKRAFPSWLLLSMSIPGARGRPDSEPVAGDDAMTEKALSAREGLVARRQKLEP